MAYEFIKLSEVEQVETSQNANLFIEEDGEIKRLPISKVGGGKPQIQADWNETDDTSPAYIANKPDVGSTSVIKYTLDCGGQMYLNGEAQTVQQVLDNWNRGAVMRVSLAGSENSTYPIVNCGYELVCGSMQCYLSYLGFYGNLQGCIIY